MTCTRSTLAMAIAFSLAGCDDGSDAQPDAAPADDAGEATEAPIGDEQAETPDEPTGELSVIGLSHPVKVAHWNVKSGFGVTAMSGGTCAYTGVGSSNCATNAWGNGYFKQVLDQYIRPDVVALSVNEAWTCATPEAIRAYLGWAAKSTLSADGVAIIARHGFTGPCSLLALTKCSSTAFQRYAVHCPVRVAAGSSESLDVFSTHLSGCESEGIQLRSFAVQKAPAPRQRVVLGDFNSGATSPVHSAWLTSNWREIGSGSTSTWHNGSRSAAPYGNLYKRIDYAWFKFATGSAFSRFNHDGAVTSCKASDHAGIKLTVSPP